MESFHLKKLTEWKLQNSISLDYQRFSALERSDDSGGLITLQKLYIFFLLALQPPLGVVFYSPLGGFSLLACEVSRSHTTTRHSRQDSSERMISPSQRPLPDNTQHSQHTNIQALGGIRTHDRSRRAAVDLCISPRGHWDRPKSYIGI